MNSITKTIELAAPVSKVWAAVTDSQQFCVWFRAKLDGPFVVGQTVRGHSTYPGHEDAQFVIHVKAMEPERYFAFTWPASMESDVETLVEFTLEAVEGGTRLRVVESGFEKLPADVGARAFRDNGSGWEIQMENVAAYVGEGA